MLDVTTSAAVTTTTASPATSVLVLSTANSANKPMIVDFNGNVNEDLNFEYGEEVTVYDGCGASFMGEFWYFGGDGAANNRQVITLV